MKTAPKISPIAEAARLAYQSALAAQDLVGSPSFLLERTFSEADQPALQRFLALRKRREDFERTTSAISEGQAQPEECPDSQDRP
jgi:hypothetical protein